jgi:signal transduction histidine kinase
MSVGPHYQLLAVDDDRGDLELMNGLDRGTVDVQSGVFDFRRTAQEVVAGFAVEAAWKGVRLRVDMPAVLPRVRGDAGMIRQVVANLVDNAVRATPADGEVTVRAEFSELSDDMVRVVVRDTGNGISPAYQKRLFDRSRPDRRIGGWEPDGMGLGLPVCRAVLERHGEDIVVQSEPGRGSAFVFVLPCHPGVPGSEAPTNAPKKTTLKETTLNEVIA